ncbi:MAG: sugar transferase [Acidobacteriota bacterium]|nr:sugar transferase [Acidobacteriota bacterium]
MIRIFRVFIPASILGLVLSEVLIALLSYVGASVLLFEFINPEFSPVDFFESEGGFLRIGLAVACIVAGLYFQNLYTEFRIKSVTVLLQQLCMAIGGSFLVQAFLTYLKRPEWAIPKWMMIFGSVLTLVLIPAWRLFYGTVVMKAMGRRRVLFLGTSSVVREIATYLSEHNELGMNVLGYVDNDPEPGELPGGKLLGNVCELADLARSLNPDLVVVGLAERRHELPVNEMLHLRFSGVHFEEAPVTFESTFGRILTRQLRPSRLIFSTELGPKKHSLLWHTLYSFFLSLILTAIFSPVMLIVAVLVKLTSRGPVFHRQSRVGLNNCTFTVYKFRSMYANAEAGTGPVWATKDDPRITPLGRWIRRLRLDELPQLLNVLKGEMSLVGPRPERPEFVTSLSEKIPFYSYRHCVKPGITGWAQINYKYGDTLEDTIIKLEYDLYYIKNLALSLDTFIIFHTMKVMFFSETAQ